MPTTPNSPTETDKENSADNVLAEVTHQTVQTSQTLALHVKQHDDIEGIAQERANAVIAKVSEELEERYKSVLTAATEQARKEIAEARKLAGEDRQQLQNAYDSALTAAVDALQKERAEEKRQYELFCTKTAENLQTLLTNAVEQSNEATQSSMEQTRVLMNQEQESKIAEAIANVNARSAKLTKILIGASATGAAIAIAASAIVATLL